jgi:hypothetical protein
MTVINVPMLERYEINAITGCWIWLGHKDANGYARAGDVNAHRAVYIAHGHPVPQGFDLDHLCKRRDCVNPAHMEVVTEVENIARKSRTVIYRGRQFDICRKGHALEGENLRIRRGKRVCEACRVDNYVARSKAKAEAAGREYRPYKYEVSA